jgi:lactoylglutathione lyase
VALGLLFTKVGTVILLVSDMDRSATFYEEVLGLPIKTRSSDWVEFFTRETTLSLHPVKNSSKIKPSTGGVLVGFMVGDLESTAKILEEKKVKFFKKPKNESFGKHAIIEDPDGYLISIAEIKSKAADEFDLLGLLGTE